MWELEREDFTQQWNNRKKQSDECLYQLNKGYNNNGQYEVIVVYMTHYIISKFFINW